MNLPTSPASLASLSLGLPSLGSAGSRDAAAAEQASGEWFLAAEPGARISLPTHALAHGDPAALAQRVLAHLIATPEP